MRIISIFSKIKRNENNNIIAFSSSSKKSIMLLLTAILFFGCTEKEDPIHSPTVTSSQMSEITSITASSGGNVTFDGGSDILARGVCWGVSNAPTIDDSKTVNGTGTGNFTSLLTELLPNTTYYLRAYATNILDTNYGGEIAFTTNEAPVTDPIFTSSSISEITAETASSGGTISADGGSDILARGVCWSVTNAPTIADSKTIDGTGTGNFTSVLTELIPNTTYYLRVYVTTNLGTFYGEEIEFTTNEAPVTDPIFTSSAISEITAETASSGGTISADGGSDIIARGACWSVTNAPTIADSKTIDGTGIGNFTSVLTELIPNTTYYLRVYVTTDLETFYGEEITFTTNEAPVTDPIFTSLVATEITAETASSGGTITSDGGSDILARGVCWSVTNTPTIADSKTIDGTGIGNFTSVLTELIPNTTYYLRAYVTTNLGTFYGEEKSFTTSSNTYSGDVYLKNQQEVNDFGNMGYTIVTGDVVVEPSIPTTFSNLNGLSSLTSIGGSLLITKTIGLQNLSDLRNLSTVGHDISLSFNQGLTSIGLENLSSVGNYVFINYNENLIDLEGLTKLRSNGGKPDLSIWNNVKLKDFCAIKPLLNDFTGIFSVTGNLYNPTRQNIVDGNCSQ